MLMGWRLGVVCVTVAVLLYADLGSVGVQEGDRFIVAAEVVPGGACLGDFQYWLSPEHPWVMHLWASEGFATTWRGAIRRARLTGLAWRSRGRGALDLTYSSFIRGGGTRSGAEWRPSAAVEAAYDMNVVWQLGLRLSALVMSTPRPSARGRAAPAARGGRRHLPAAHDCRPARVPLLHRQPRRPQARPATPTAATTSSGPG